MTGPAAVPGTEATGLDVRTRLLALAAFAVVTVSLEAWLCLVLALGLAIAGAGALRTEPGRVRRAFGHLEAPLLCLLLTVPLTVAGTPVLALGGLQVSDAGLALAGRLVIKIAAVGLAVATLVGGLPPTLLARGLASLGLPSRLVQVLFLSGRYVALLRREYETLGQAMRARAFRPSTNLHTLTAYGTLVGLLLVRALLRAERVRDAMRCRGFTGHFPVLAAGAWPRPERIGLAAGCLALGVLLAADRAGWVAL